MKTKVTYMYRCASNYKFRGEFIIDGKLERKDIEPFLFDIEFFIPHEVGLDHLLNMPMNQDDHFLHTFEDFELAEDGDAICSASEFIERMKNADGKGWFSSFSPNMLPMTYGISSNLS